MAEFIQNFHLVRPFWLLALIPLLGLLIILFRYQGHSKKLAQFINPQLLPYLLDGEQIKQSRWPLFILGLLWLLSTFALAGPAWQKLPQPVEQKQSSLVICWDLSPSMLAEDIKPSRVMRSRLKLIDLLESRKEGQTALIAFSGEAYIVTPLTDDIKTIVNLLPALSPETMPAIGSNPEMAFEEAERLLKDAGASKGDILMIVDEITSDAMDNLKDLVSDSPYQLSLWGVGTSAGAPIPLPQGGFAKDNNGNIVVPKLNEKALQSFSTQLGAYYVPMVTNDSDIETLSQLLDDPLAETVKADKTFDQWFEHGQWLVLLLLPFAALCFRRGFIFALVLALPFSFSSPKALAFEWQSLWLNQDQLAQKKLDEGKKEAASQFDSYDQSAYAHFQNGDFKQAAAQYDKGQGAQDFYNKGVSLSKDGEFDEALKAYDRALELNPNLEAAKKNKAITQQLADLQKQMQDQAQQQSDGQQNQGDQGQSDQSQQQAGSDEAQSEQESSQQNGQDQQQANSQNQQGQDQQSDQGQSSTNKDQQASDSQSVQQDGDESGKQEQELNPYAKAEDEQNDQEKQSEQEISRVSQSSSQGADENDDQNQVSQVLMQEGQAEGQTEEQQMLEQMLRKVPDDPSGLLREKFKYQYNQRKRSVEHNLPYTNNEAEKRW